MSKALSLLLSFIVVFVLTVSSSTSGQAATQTALMSAETINIAHFFKPPNMVPAAAAASFNMIVLTNGDHTYRQQLADSGYSSTIPEYFRADGIQNPGSCTETPLNNQAAYKTGDFCMISQNHPDWFLLDQYGRRITVTIGGEYYRMDPANPGWRSFFLQRVIESQQQHGWSALFLDNVEGGLGKFYGPKPVKYPDHLTYQTAVAGFLQYLDVNYSQRYNRPIIGNIVARTGNPVWFRYLQYLDGAMQERFAVDWDETSYLSVSRWEKDMRMMERSQASGKYVILVAPGNRTDVNRQTFAFASYLLISNGRAAFRYSTDDAYREVWLYGNYNTRLGEPRGARYLQGNVWRRDFTNGYVTVDPAGHTASIVVPKTVYDDRHPAFSYSGSWQDKVNDQALRGSYKLTTTPGSSASLQFTGGSFTVVYRTGPGLGKMEVYLDGALVKTLDQRTDAVLFRKKWSYEGSLGTGTHTLKFVFVGPDGTKGSLDGVKIP